MQGFTRRQSLAAGAATLGVAALGATVLPLVGARAADSDVPTADVKPPGFQIEKGATLRVLRPAKFVDPDEVFFRANTKKFTDTTGIDVRVDFVSWEDLRPQTAVTANTGAGPDIIIGFSADPQIYATKLVDMSDLAGYLGAKYGGWFQLAQLYGTKWGTKEWLSIPMGGSTGPTVYRMSWLKAGRLRQGARRPQRVSHPLPEAEAERPSRRLRARPRGGRRQRVRQLAAVDARRGADRRAGQGGARFEGDHRRAEIRPGTVPAA